MLTTLTAATCNIPICNLVWEEGTQCLALSAGELSVLSSREDTNVHTDDENSLSQKNPINKDEIREDRPRAFCLYYLLI